MRYLITGVGSGLGKYLAQNIDPNEHEINGIRRDSSISTNLGYDVIIHCAYDKSSIINERDHYRTFEYINDNLLFTYDLTKLKYNKFIYISSIDIYDKDNLYSTFKRYAESVVYKIPNSLILRCSMMLGETMKPNHLTKLRDNIDLTLAPNSYFNYILMEDVLNFINHRDYKNYNGIIDFVSNSDIILREVQSYFGSTSKLGDYTHESQHKYFKNPIYKLDDFYNKSSYSNLNRYYGK